MLGCTAMRYLTYINPRRLPFPPQSLPKFEHVRMISQTGLLEFKLGDQGALLLLPLPTTSSASTCVLLLLLLRPNPARPNACCPAARGRWLFGGVLHIYPQRFTLDTPFCFHNRNPLTTAAERGRSLFEGVLRNYPKRLDLWSVYLDQEVAAGDQQRIR